MLIRFRLVKEHKTNWEFKCEQQEIILGSIYPRKAAFTPGLPPPPYLDVDVPEISLFPEAKDL